VPLIEKFAEAISNAGTFILAVGTTK
jgi:hypothetical protein